MEHINTLCGHSKLQAVYTITTIFRAHYCLVWSRAGRRDWRQIMMQRYPPHQVWEDSLETFMPISHSTRRHIPEDLTLKLINSQSRNNHHPTSSVISSVPKPVSSRPFLTPSCTQNRGRRNYASPSESSMYHHYQTVPKGMHPTPALPPKQEHSQNLKEDAEGNNLATFIGESRPRNGRTRLRRPQGMERDWMPREYLPTWKHTCNRRNSYLKSLPLTLKEVY